MKLKIRFHKGYFLMTALLFIVEVLIARYLDDKIIRPYVGDVLVVILVYCFVRTFLNIPVVATAVAALLFACLVEFLQYLRIVDTLGLQDSKLAGTVLGTSAEWTDIAAYSVGAIVILLCEKIIARRTKA